MRQGVWISTLVLMLGCAHVGAPDPRPDFTGMWSDPPSTAVDGDRLEAIVTMEDPWSLRQAVQVKKAWGFAPAEEIFPYVDCERPSEFRKGVSQP